MITLTYHSTATHEFGVVELVDLLESARTSNVAEGITGMLLYADGYFIQTLEGAEDAVTEVFARIQADPRHHDLQVMRRETTDRRAYHGWSMGFDHLTATQALEVAASTHDGDPAGHLYRAVARLGLRGSDVRT